jgi:cbb3-type cytochrome oxidase cytochrome c subunit
LNGTWVYRWLKNPQAMNAESRMPALGLSDADAKAVTLYLTTLKGETADDAAEAPAAVAPKATDEKKPAEKKPAEKKPAEKKK